MLSIRVTILNEWVGFSGEVRLLQHSEPKFKYKIREIFIFNI